MKVRRIFAIAVALGVAVLPATASASTGWVIQPTPGLGVNNYNALQSVSCTAATACTAVGSSSSSSTTFTLAERWNGTSWKVQSTPNPSGELTSSLGSVKCVSATNCTAVGWWQSLSNDGDQMMAERWNGTSWKLQLIPNPAGIADSQLNAVACTSATNCMAIGGYVDGPIGDNLAEHWNGTSWKYQLIPGPAGVSFTDLQGISCTTATACTAAGYYDINGTDTPLAERWNGTSWKIQSVPSPAGGQNPTLAAVKCTSGTWCVAVGSYTASSGSQTLAESWNGTGWAIIPTSAAGELNGVSCSSASSCTAVGTGPNQSATLAQYWNGTSWAVQSTPNPAGNTGAILSADSCMSATTCTAVGSYSDSSSNSQTLAEQET